MVFYLQILQNNMAEADITLQLSNLDLGEFGEETERPEIFWIRTMIAMKFNVESKWLDAVWRCKTKPNYRIRILIQRSKKGAR